MNIDTICKMTRNAEMLNALHACRPGNPLNHPHAFRHAWFLAIQRTDISFEAAQWLEEQDSARAAA